MKTYYYLYKITNLINNKIYVGMHRTTNLDDDYMGSGTVLKLAITKYGIENFEKEILQFFDSQLELSDAESKVVNEEFIHKTSTYNIALGGTGNWDYINPDGLTMYQLAAQALISKLENNEEFRNKFSESSRNTLYNYTLPSLRKKYGDGEWTFSGKHHSEETKRKIGEANSKHQSGSGNSNYGTQWISNTELKKSKRIPKQDVIPDGWVKGRNKWIVHTSSYIKVKRNKNGLSNLQEQQIKNLAKKKAKRYSINGIIYYGSENAAKHFDIIYRTVINRCKSDKFPTWFCL